MIWYQEPGVEFRLGDVIDELRALPAESVDVCVTSPPYYGVRDYKIPPSIWSGDASCDHEWGPARAIRGVGNNSGTRGSQEAATPFTGAGPKLAPLGQSVVSAGQFCALCGAFCGCLGNEPDATLYVEHLVAVFREVRRVLKKTGTLWCNLGDSYAGSGGANNNSGITGKGVTAGTAQDDRDGPKNYPSRLGNGGGKGIAGAVGYKAKDLMMIPARVAIALQADGWYLRSDIIWAKPNPLPESVMDRPTNNYEHIFLLAKSAKYYYDAEAIKEVGTSSQSDIKKMLEGRDRITNNTAAAGPAGRNMRAVWTIATESYKGAHFATFPTEIPRRAIAAGSSEYGYCATCGQPWTRVVERVKMVIRSGMKASGYESHTTSGVTGTMVSPPLSRAVGWQPSCTCGAPVVPAVVCDPFLGSGTTAQVAMSMGRHVIGIDRSEKYLRLARQRILNPVPPEQPDSEGDMQLGLFAVEGAL